MLLLEQHRGMVIERSNIMYLENFEDLRCAICRGTCGEQENIFAYNEMHLLAFYLDVPEDAMLHDRVAVHRGTFASDQYHQRYV